MPRLSAVSRDALSADNQKAYDAIVASRGEVRGPFAAIMHSPELAGRIAHTGTYVRFETTVPKLQNELAILTVARHWDADYEWVAHEIQAKEAGARVEAIAAIGNRAAPAGLTDEEALTVKFALELLDDHKVSDATFNAAKEKLGDQGVTDLTVTVGYYSLISCVLNSMEMKPDKTTLPA